MNGDVIKATRATRLKFGASWLFALAVLIGGVVAKRLLHQQAGSTLSELLLTKGGVLGIYAAMGLGAGLLLMQRGRTVLRVGQFPLPDAWVIRDTAIRRGRRATARAYALICAGAVVLVGSVLLLCFFMAYVVPRLVDG